MAFANDNYAKIWDLYDDDIKKARISTSRKNANGDYEQDFSGFVSFFGDAKDEFDALEAGDNIKILKCACQTKYDSKKHTNYVNFNIYDFEIQDKKKKSSSKKSR